MKLIKLHIYGFGRFQDFHLELSEEPVQTILGENEKGKSTIMAFIRSILFGFPTKQQSELRYEPRLGGRYGGKVVLFSEMFGTVTIERIAGKAMGNVNVYFDNGNVAGEEALKLVLGDLDRTRFSGIYSFSATDLQSIEQLNSEELNRFLYGVGMSGRHTLLEIEKKTEKEMAELYKPTGRKPIINSRIKRISDVEEKLNQWKKKLSEHEELVNERTRLNETFQQLTAQKETVNKRIRYLEKLQSVAPTVIEKRMSETELRELPLFEPFPEDGVQRLEKLTDRIVTLEAEVVDLEFKLERMKEQLVEFRFSETIRQTEETVAQMRETRKIYDAKKEEKNVLSQQLQVDQQAYEMMKQKLGQDHYQPFRFDTCFLAEQKIEKLSEKKVDLDQQGKILQAQLLQSQTVLEEKERQKAKIAAQLLDKEKRKELEVKVSNQKNRAELKQELYYIYDLIQQLTDQLHTFSKPESKGKMPFTIIGWSCLMLAIVLLIVNQWQLSISFIFISCFIIVFNRKNSNSSYTKMVASIEERLATHQQRKQYLEEQIALEVSEQGMNVLDIVKKDKQLHEHLLLIEISVKEAEENYQQVCKELDSWEIQYVRYQEELQGWVDEYSYPSSLQVHDYIKLLKMVDDIRRKEKEMVSKTAKRQLLSEELEKIESDARDLCQLFRLSPSNDYLENIERVSLSLKQELQKEKQYERLADKMEIEVAKLKTVTMKVRNYQQEKKRLFDIALVHTEEEFRQKAKAWEESRKLKEQIRILKSQLMPSVRDEEELSEIEQAVLKQGNEMADQLASCEIELKALFEKEKFLHQQMAKINMEIKELEEGSSFSNSLHNYENEKGNLKEEVRKWVFHRTVQLLVDEAKALYEKERQPIVLKNATQYFSFMTNGEYNKLYAPLGERKFIVEHYDGTRFEPNELSQGTKEQLYLAIRLALASVHSSEISYPIMIDDTFVNFDQKRRIQALLLLKELSNKHQILFFTCHPFMAEEMTSNYYCLQ